MSTAAQPVTGSPPTAPLSAKHQTTVRLRSDIVERQRRIRDLRGRLAAEEAQLREDLDVAIRYDIPLLGDPRQETEPPPGLAGTDGGDIRGGAR